MNKDEIIDACKTHGCISESLTMHESWSERIESLLTIDRMVELGELLPGEPGSWALPSARVLSPCERPPQREAGEGELL